MFNKLKRWFDGKGKRAAALTATVILLCGFTGWQKQAQMWRDGEITKEDYDQWRYKYPELDKSNKRRHKITPSSKLNDAITDKLMKERGRRGK